MDAVFQTLVAAFGVLLSGVGVVDTALTDGMTGLGLDPAYQGALLLVATVALAAYVLRAVGGFAGWIMVVLLVLLPVHHFSSSMPDESLRTPLSDVFNR